MRNDSLFLLGTGIFFLALLAWMAWSRHEDFLRHHRTVAQQTVTGLADEVARSIAGRKRLVRLFAREQAELLQALARDPENPLRQQAVAERLRDYFPDLDTFTLADADGELLVEDFGERIGPLCRDDIRRFLRTGENLPRLHPGPRVYHFDILARLRIDGEPRIFFVSFPADVLASLLQNVQRPEHELYLILPGPPPLFEITAAGARHHLSRTDYHFTGDEMARLLARMPVNGTRWQVAVLARPRLFADFSKDLLLQSLLMFLPFLLFTLIMGWRFRRQERLRRAAELARDEFLATVSHELRTPLTAIHGALGLIANGVTGPIGERTGEILQIARKNSDRLILLVNDLLDMRRLESGSLEMVMAELELHEVLHQAIEENRGYLSQFGARCELSTDRGAIRVRGDRNRLVQVLTNLLSNAAKYGPRGGTIRVHTHCDENTVRISVTDQGTGIPPAFQPRLFEKFARHDSSDTRAVSGTGLGLSIAKAIVEAHGGHIGFYSSRSGGTTFYFELPLQERDEERGKSGEGTAT